MDRLDTQTHCCRLEQFYLQGTRGLLGKNATCSLRAGAALTAQLHAALLCIPATELVFSQMELYTHTWVFTACLQGRLYPAVCTFYALVLKNADSFKFVEGGSLRMSN